MILLKGKRIFVLIAVFTLLILISGSASSATLYVKEGGGTGSYENLQEAVNAASEGGDIILVGKGQYSENVLVNKSLEISSTNHNPEKTVITALDPEAPPVFHIVSDSVKISGFSIKGGKFHIWNLP